MKISELVNKKPLVGWMLFALTTLVVFLLGLFASSIIQRRTEATVMNIPIYKLDEFEPRNELWGISYPRQYDRFLQMKDTTFRSKYGGSGFIDALEDNPGLVILFAGYAFARDYNQPKSHFYSIEDVYRTLRTGTPDSNTPDMQKSSCWTCKSADVPRLVNEMGAEDFFNTPWSEMLSEVINPIGCVNCHNPENQHLRISQVPLIEAFERKNLNINDFGLNEKRSLVCAQCHVEYYFKGEKSYVTLPWDKGLSVEEIEEYFDSYGFYDWIHALSKTPLIKAQHPDYELYTTGIHYERGVSCADCHMPYITEGSQKITDHKVQSPLNNIENSCMVCHRDNKDELLKNVYDRQDKVYEQRKLLEERLVKAHIETEYVIYKGATDEQLKTIHKYIRSAQWRWDFIAASHGASFHAPLETMRIISSGMDKAATARIEISRLLADLGHNYPVPMPDISSKEKAQEYVGLNMQKLKDEKNSWLNEFLPSRIENALQRQSQMPMPDRIR